MAFSKEALVALIALQERDDALDKLRAEMERIPVQTQALRDKLEGEKTRLGQCKARYLSLEKRKKEKELELAQREEAAKKHGMELNQVKTNEAFKALQKEIEQAKTQAGLIETEILEIMVEIDSCRKEEKSLAADFASVEKGVSSEIAALDARYAEVKGRVEAAQAAREEAAAPLPAEVMRIYNHVRSRGKLNAVAPIDGSNCSACRINLAPQVVVEATKAKSLVTCESCQRILYRPEALAAKAA